jgi:hypothetical protein
MKIFSNGGLQMTGIRTEAGGREAARFTAEIVHGLGLLEESDAVDSSCPWRSTATCVATSLSSAAAWPRHGVTTRMSTVFDPITYPALKLLYFYS